jgi:hypothetical protein
MPNVTITVSEELKAEMDKLSEVSWSEICRNAISLYISERGSPTPKIELDVRSSRLTDYDSETGYPALIMDIRIQNRMNSEIRVDRILANVKSFPQEGSVVSFGQANDLQRKAVGSNSIGSGTLRLALPSDKLKELQGIFKSTFDCYVFISVFVDGFKNSYDTQLVTQIPIDVWKGVVETALKRFQATP